MAAITSKYYNGARALKKVCSYLYACTFHLILITIISCNNLFAAAYHYADTIKPVKTCITGQYKNFFADAMGNLFLQLPNNGIKKINSNGDSVGLFNDVRRYGNLENMDVSNPLKVILFYKDFGGIVVLDRFLNLRNTIDLRLSGVLQPAAVAQSYDNNYWVFDAIEYKLKKIDDKGEIAFSTADFRLLFNEIFMPQVIIDDNTKLYLYDINYGWIIFDYYGAFLQKVPAAGWTDVQVLSNKLCGRKDQSRMEYFYKTFTENILPLPPSINTSAKLLITASDYITLEQDGICRYPIMPQ